MSPSRQSGNAKLQWMMIVAITVFFCFFVAITEIKDLVLRNQDVTSESIALARNSPLVQEQLGDNIRVSWPIRGDFTFSSEDGSAKLILPIMGRRGHARLYVDAVKLNGQWDITSTTFSKYPQGEWKIK